MHKTVGLKTRTSLTVSDERVLVAVGSLEGDSRFDERGDGTAYIIDAKSGEIVSRITEHQGRVYGVDFCKDKSAPTLLATCSADFSVRLWRESVKPKEDRDDSPVACMYEFDEDMEF